MSTAFADIRTVEDIQKDINDTNQKIASLMDEKDAIKQAIMIHEQKIVQQSELQVTIDRKKNELASLHTQYENSIQAHYSYSGNGLLAEIYNNQGYNNAPPIPGEDRKVAETYVPNIDFQWGGGRVLDTLYEDVAVKFTGTITSQSTQDVQLYAPGDDGVKVYIDNELVINDWYDKGGGGSYSQLVHFEANTPRQITLWFYENGGGANVWLYWNGQIVPPEAFKQQIVDYTADETILVQIKALESEISELDRQNAELMATIANEQIDGNRINSINAEIETYKQVLIDLNQELELAKQPPLPSPSPVVSVEPSPVPSESPTPTPIPTQTPEPTPVQTIEPTPTPVSAEPSVGPTPVIQPSTAPIIVEPSPSPSEPIVEQPSEQMQVVIPEISLSNAAQAAKEFIKDVFTNPAKAVAQLNNVRQSMTEKERESARRIVVSAVLVNNVLSLTGASAIRRGG